MFTLTFEDSGLPRVHQLQAGETLIGRAPHCGLVLNAPSVSRVHARLRVADGRCFLADAGSRFGTMLLGVPLEGESPLRPGDAFQLGDVVLTLEQSVGEDQLLSEHHQLLDEPDTILRRVDRPLEDRRVDAPSGAVAPERARGERRSGQDRRREDQGWPEGERRSGRDRRSGRLLKLLSEISKTLIAVQPLSQVLARVIDLVFDTVPAERAFLMLRSSADQALTARVLRNRDGSVPEHATLSRTVVNTVMADRVAMLASDAWYDPRLDTAGSIQAMGIRSFLCAPLWHNNDLMGVLYADNPRARKFLPEDLEVFTAIANYAAVAIEQARLSEQLMQEVKRRERLQRYHSPGVVNRILQSGTGTEAPFVAQERDVSVMFCDIVGFTSLSEKMRPHDIAALLNRFCGEMTEVIFQFEGTLDKFIGDAILSVFGAPFPQPDHADRCVQAALAMRRKLAVLNRNQPDPPLQLRFGICSGPAMTGDMGSPKRREFTVLGDVVNTASRLQSAVAKPDQIVIARGTYEQLKRHVDARFLGTVDLRGRISKVDVFEVAG